MAFYVDLIETILGFQFYFLLLMIEIFFKNSAKNFFNLRIFLNSARVFLSHRSTDSKSNSSVFVFLLKLEFVKYPFNTNFFDAGIIFVSFENINFVSLFCIDKISRSHNDKKQIDSFEFDFNITTKLAQIKILRTLLIYISSS